MAVSSNADLVPGHLVKRAGVFTKAAYLRGVGAREIEARLGYNKGRLDAGWWLLFLMEMPGPQDFRLRGKAEDPAARGEKERLIAEVFTLKGSARLAKAAVKAGPLGEQEEPDFPAVRAAPLWELRADRPLTWKVAAFLREGEVYGGFYI